MRGGTHFTSSYVTCHHKEALPLSPTKPTVMFIDLSTRAERYVNCASEQSFCKIYTLVKKSRNNKFSMCSPVVLT